MTRLPVGGTCRTPTGYGINGSSSANLPPATPFCPLRVQHSEGAGGCR